MKKSLLAISAITLLSIFTFSCAKEEPEPVNKTVTVTSVSMNTSSVSPTVGESTTLTATVKPDNATRSILLSRPYAPGYQAPAPPVVIKRR